jgi:hypothetical protein
MKKKNINQCKTFWFLSKFPITIPFNKNNENRAITSYKKNKKKNIELGVRNFLKALIIIRMNHLV